MRSTHLSVLTVLRRWLGPMTKHQQLASKVKAGVRMGRFPKPCLVCGELTKGLSRCDQHQAEWQTLENIRLKEMKARRPPLYTSQYRQRAKTIRDNALFCHLCKEPAKPNDPFTADHLIPGDPDSPLAAAHRSCNSRRGNKPLV
jgi:5-methylcytosine-specific restriction protein A